MRYEPPLIPAILLKRYKRFLADVQSDALGGVELTAHCANPGSMRGLIEAGGRAWLFDSRNPKRKLRYSLELVELEGGATVCVNTARANQVVFEALLAQEIDAFRGYTPRAEVRWTEGAETTRFDFHLTSPEGGEVFLEVKSVTYLMGVGLAGFPDSVTTRGQKHLRSLIEVAESGRRAALLFCVNRDDVEIVAPATEIDPIYGMTLIKAREAGVELYAFAAEITPEGIQLGRALEVQLNE